MLFGKFSFQAILSVTHANSASRIFPSTLLLVLLALEVVEWAQLD